MSLLSLVEFGDDQKRICEDLQDLGVESGHWEAVGSGSHFPPPSTKQSNKEDKMIGP